MVIDSGQRKAHTFQQGCYPSHGRYENPGPIQLSGPSADAPALTITSKFSYMRELDTLTEALAKVGKRCRPGCDPKTVRVAAQSLVMLNTILDELSGPPDAVELHDA